MFTDEQKIDILKRIIEINDLKSSYNGCKKAPEFTKNGRLHFNVEQIGYDGTARVYTKDFSVNQLTKPMRECVTPNPGKKFLYLDFSAAELYILSYWSKCTKMLEWFSNGEDVHTNVMKTMLNKEEVTKADRAVSKVLSFATCYGGNAFTIAKDLNCSEDEGAEFLDKYKKAFPEFEQFKLKMIQYAHTNGCTKTIFGRFRRIPTIFSNAPEEVSKAERQVVNTAIQASCADFLKEGTNRLRKFEDIRVCMQCFDSYLIEVPENITDERVQEILDTVCDFNDIFPGFRFNCEWSFGYNWKDAQESC